MTKKTKHVLCVEPGVGTVICPVKVDGGGNMRDVPSITLIAEPVEGEPAAVPLRVEVDPSGALRLVDAAGAATDVTAALARAERIRGHLRSQVLYELAVRAAHHGDPEAVEMLAPIAAARNQSVLELAGAIQAERRAEMEAILAL